MYRRRCWWTQLPSTKWSQNQVAGSRTSISSRPQSERWAVLCEQRCSHTGTRTRVCWVRASYPNRLDYMGKLTSWHTNTFKHTISNRRALKHITVLIAQCCWSMHDTNKSWMLESTILIFSSHSHCVFRVHINATWDANTMKAAIWPQCMTAYLRCGTTTPILHICGGVATVRLMKQSDSLLMLGWSINGGGTPIPCTVFLLSPCVHVGRAGHNILGEIDSMQDSTIIGFGVGYVYLPHPISYYFGSL